MFLLSHPLVDVLLWLHMHVNVIVEGVFPLCRCCCVIVPWQAGEGALFLTRWLTEQQDSLALLAEGRSKG